MIIPVFIYFLHVQYKIQSIYFSQIVNKNSSKLIQIISEKMNWDN